MIGDKTRRWMMLNKNPEQAFMAEMDAMDRKNESAAQASITKLSLRWDKMIQNLYRAAARILDEMEPRLAKKFEQMAQARLDSLPHLKGKDGYTPKKGVDYSDGKPGDPGAAGTTPKADIDFPTIPTVKKMIEGEVAVAMFDKKTGMPAGSVLKAIAEAFKKIPAELIARSLETLEGAERLSYKALKDTPGYDVGGHRHTIHRGGSNSVGGKETYEYDLSSFCNGVLKTFTIPTNVRIVAVMCTDAPAGFLRKNVDYTGSGTTTLTLDAGIAAPTIGASLSVLYVV